MSVSELSDTQAAAWGSKSRPGSRDSSRSQIVPSSSSLRRSNSRARTDLNRSPPADAVYEDFPNRIDRNLNPLAGDSYDDFPSDRIDRNLNPPAGDGYDDLPNELRNQLGELLDDDRTRETLVDHMNDMTKQVRQRPVRPRFETAQYNYMNRAGSPLRGRSRERYARHRNSDRAQPRIDYSGYQGDWEADWDRGGNRDRRRQPESLDIDFSQLEGGPLSEMDQTRLKALAKVLVLGIVPRLKDELSAELTHNSLITRERRAGMINAPRVFPVELQLIDMDRSASNRYNQYWVSVFKKKFNGDPKKSKYGSPEIDYFLNRLNSSQHFFPLSETEFKDHLQNFTEAPAWNKVTSMMYQQLPLQEIYNKLLAVYDKREKSHEATLKLEALKFHDFSSWAEAETEVERLAMRASLARTSVRGDGQRALFHYLSTKHLVAILPEPLKLEAERRINTYCNATGQELKFYTLVEMMEKDRDAIDRLLSDKAHGRGRKKKENGEMLAITDKTSKGNFGKGTKTAKPKGEVREIALAAAKVDVGEVRAVDFKREAANGRGYETKPKGSLCRKCKIPGHEEAKCDYYVGPPSNYVCNHCHMDAYHQRDRCLFKRHLIKRKGDEGPHKSSPRPGGNKPTQSKN